ncbi:hypothetical protein ANN_15171, partial [Periplaneta americana]
LFRFNYIIKNLQDCSDMQFLFDSFILNLVTTVTIILTAIYLYFTRHFNFWKKHEIPFVKPTPFVGNLKEVFFQKLDINSHLKNIYNDHKNNPYVGIFSFDRPTLLVNDLDLIKKILVKDSQHFVDHIIAVDEKLDPMFAKILFSLKGRKWRHTRNNVTPTFTSGKIKKMFHIVNTCAQELVHYLHKATADGSAVQTMETMCKYTTDVISSCAFGIESNSLKNPDAEIRGNFRKIFENTLLKGIAGLFMFFAPNLQNFFRLKFVDDEYANFLRKTVWSTVEYREKYGIIRNDFLDCLMELRRKGREMTRGHSTEEVFSKCLTTLRTYLNMTYTNVAGLDGDDFVGMVFSFFIAGFETSASTLTFALYELAFKPEIQAQLRIEICRHQRVTYDALQDMPLLDMVVAGDQREPKVRKSYNAHLTQPVTDRPVCSYRTKTLLSQPGMVEWGDKGWSVVTQSS